jgi:predicted transglutaminase-like protease
MSLEELKELKILNWNNPYTNRSFEVDDKESVKYLISNYRKNFAFSVDYNNNHFVIYKDYMTNYIRNDKNFKFEFPHCPPPVSSIHELKSENIQDIIEFILNN